MCIKLIWYELNIYRSAEKLNECVITWMRRFLAKSRNPVESSRIILNEAWIILLESKLYQPHYFSSLNLFIYNNFIYDLLNHLCFQMKQKIIHLTCLLWQGDRCNFCLNSPSEGDGFHLWFDYIVSAKVRSPAALVHTKIQVPSLKRTICTWEAGWHY